MNTLSVGIVVALIACSSALVIKSGKCPSPQVVENFNVEKYLGVWYEQEKYPQPFQSNGKCVQATYGARDDGAVSVLNSMVDKTSNVEIVIKGSAALIENGKLLVKFDNIPSFSDKPNYWVLDTDYTSYTVVYNCNQVSDDTNIQSAWILSRDRVAQPELINTAHAVLTKNSVTLEELEKTDQTSQC